jgi:hypothetical protein
MWQVCVVDSFEGQRHGRGRERLKERGKVQRIEDMFLSFLLIHLPELDYSSSKGVKCKLF